MIVTGASALPSARSGSGPGRISSSTEASAKAREAEPSNAAAAMSAPVETTNSRRVMREVPLELRPRNGGIRYPDRPIMAMWRCLAASRKSRSLDRGAKPGEGAAQVLVADIGHAGSKARHHGRIRGLRRLFRLAARERSLADLDAADRAPAEEAVHPFDDDSGKVLDFQRHRPFHAQHQRGRFRVVLMHAARPSHAHRFGMVGDFRSDDLRPMGDDTG